MSEVIVTGAAGVALGACVAAAALVAGGAFLAYKAISWLSAEAVGEIEKLERALAAPLALPTTREAREEFQHKLTAAREQARRNPLLRPHADSVAAILAVRNSALGRFATADDVKALTRPHLARSAVSDVLKSAQSRMNFAATSFVTDAVIEVGKATGFAFNVERTHARQHETIVLKKGDGRALIAQVQRTPDGPSLKLDLTGYADGACHGVMDDVLRRLSDKGIRLYDVNRRSHFRRDGVLAADLQASQAAARSAKTATPQNDERDRCRRAAAGQQLRQPIR